MNEGCLVPIEVRAPRGSLVNALPPAAVAAGNVETSQRIVDVLFGALSRALPERIPAASQGTMNNLLLGGDGWVYYETMGGGQGGRPPPPGSRDGNRHGAGHGDGPVGSPLAGQSGIQTGMTNTRRSVSAVLAILFRKK